MKPIEILSVWIVLASVVAISLAIYDKIASKHFTQNRVRESILLFVSAIGGAAAMYLTMVMIRHKTRKPKFSIGVPIMIVVHLIVVVLLYSKGVI